MPWVFVLIWSTGFVVARFGMPHAPPLSFLSTRYALSIVCFGVWIAASHAPWPRSRDQWFHLAVVGVLIQAGYLGGVWSAVKVGMGAGTVALLVGLQPVLTALWVTLHTPGASSDAEHAAARITSRQWLGLALGLGGLVLVVWRKLGTGEVTAFSFSMTMIALLSITVGTLYQKRFVRPCDVRTASTVQMLAALVVTLPFALLEREPMVMDPELIGAMAWSVLALTLGGSSLLYLLIQRGAATQVSSLMYLVPPCTALLAWMLFDEPFTVAMAIGLALTALGVALVTASVRRPGKARRIGD
ncbi:MAG: DMT family transporter [Burkholderiales bacterium]